MLLIGKNKCSSFAESIGEVHPAQNKSAVTVYDGHQRLQRIFVSWILDLEPV